MPLASEIHPCPQAPNRAQSCDGRRLVDCTGGGTGAAPGCWSATTDFSYPFHYFTNTIPRCTEFRSAEQDAWMLGPGGGGVLPPFKIFAGGLRPFLCQDAVGFWKNTSPDVAIIDCGRTTREIPCQARAWNYPRYGWMPRAIVDAPLIHVHNGVIPTWDVPVQPRFPSVLFMVWHFDRVFFCRGCESIELPTQTGGECCCHPGDPGYPNCGRHDIQWNFCENSVHSSCDDTMYDILPYHLPNPDPCSLEGNGYPRDAYGDEMFSIYIGFDYDVRLYDGSLGREFPRPPVMVQLNALSGTHIQGVCTNGATPGTDFYAEIEWQGFNGRFLPSSWLNGPNATVLGQFKMEAGYDNQWLGRHHSNDPYCANWLPDEFAYRFTGNKATMTLAFAGQP